MRRLLFLSAALLVVPLFACESSGAAGESCTNDESCEAGLTCRQDYPGTVCAQSCPAEGDTASCPQDTVCALEFTDILMCAPTCESNDDCREGYVCTTVAGGDATACRVKLP